MVLGVKSLPKIDSKQAVSASQNDRKGQSHKGRLKRRTQKPVKQSSKMASEETNTNEYIAQAVAKAVRVSIQTMFMAVTARTESVGPRMSGPIMKQPTFDWSTKDKYAKLRNFKLEIKSMIQNFNISQTERVLIIKKWLGRQGFQLLETLTQAEQEACND